MLSAKTESRTKQLGCGGIDIACRNKVAEENKKLVHKIVHRMAVRCTEPYEDLYQLGFIGLLKAVERFNPCLGNAFSSFAVPYIQGEIQHYLRDSAPRLKTRPTLEKLGKVRRLKKQFAALNRPIEEQTIASKLGISEIEWQTIQSIATRKLTISWEELPYEPNIEESSQNNSEEIISGLYQAMAKLDSRQRYALAQHYFLDKQMEAIAKALHISLSSTDSLIQSALAILNSLLKNGYQAN